MTKSKEGLLFSILSTDSPTSYEDEVSDFFLNRFEDVAVVGKDVLGNAAVSVKGEASGSKVLVTAHSDEVGFIVCAIDPNGFLQIKPLGGIEITEQHAAPVKILTENGPISGIVCRHSIGDSGPEVEDPQYTFVDIGAGSKSVASKAVKIGSTVVWDTVPRRVNRNIIFSRGADNKLGVYVVTRVMDEIIKLSKKKSFPTTVFGLLTPREEIGDFDSAKEAAGKISPGACIVVDTDESGDYPSHSDYGCSDSFIRLGQGPIVDVGPLINKRLASMVVDTANDLGVRIQKIVSTSETSTTLDRIRFGARGVPCVGIYIPVRYIHTPMSVFNDSDVENAIKLIVKVCESLDSVESFI